MTTKGLISIIVPAYNVAPFIRTCMDSIRDQSFKDWEALVIIDPSTDGTENIVREINLDERFKLIYNDKKGGVSKARNQGFSLSHGEFIAFLDGDDFWDPNFLEEGVTNLMSSEFDVFYSEYSLEGKAVHPARIYTPGKLINGDILIPYLCGKVRVANCGAMLIKREVLERHSIEFKVGCSHCEDTEFRLKLFAVSNAIGTDRRLLHLVTREGSLSRSFYYDEFADKVAAYARALEFVRRVRPDHRAVTEIVDHWNLPFGVVEYLYKAGQTGEGAKALLHIRAEGLSNYLFLFRPKRIKDLAFFIFLFTAGIFSPARRVVATLNVIEADAN